MRSQAVLFEVLLKTSVVQDLAMPVHAYLYLDHEILMSFQVRVKGNRILFPSIILK
jgi:hypothetical protein